MADVDPIALKKAIDEQREKRQKAKEAAGIAINAAPTDPNVAILLKFLVQICGFRENPVVMNNAAEITNATTFNVGRLSVYHDIRKLMSAETENLVLKREE